MGNSKQLIAKNAAMQLKDGDFVNLGVGVPTMVSNYIPEGMEILFHGEIGCVGQDKELDAGVDFEDHDGMVEFLSTHGDADGYNWKTGLHRDLTNAGCGYISLIPGACCFDTVTSFAIARGGHLDAIILGGMQVDEEGNLANWMVPGQRVNGMGGAMDLVAGAKKVIIVMEHVAKDGKTKVKKLCDMPLTAVKCVDMLITDLCIIDFASGKPVVTAMAPGVTKEELIEKSEMTLTFADNVAVMAEP